LLGERSLDRAAVHTEEIDSLGVGKLPALEADQPVKFVGDLGQAHVDVIHPLLVYPHALCLLAQSLFMLS